MDLVENLVQLPEIIFNWPGVWLKLHDFQNLSRWFLNLTLSLGWLSLIIQMTPEACLLATPTNLSRWAHIMGLEEAAASRRADFWSHRTRTHFYREWPTMIFEIVQFLPLWCWKRLFHWKRWLTRGTKIFVVPYYCSTTKSFTCNSMDYSNLPRLLCLLSPVCS